ncbi:hypothetical protein NOG12_09150, partial [Pseudidiomarina sp. GXY010]|nr:hypothetical protein [Pseudidiomarina sp. GXY010]
CLLNRLVSLNLTLLSQFIITASGSCYKLIGEGQKAQVQIIDFELLRQGFSPEQITQLNLAPNGFFH